MKEKKRSSSFIKMLLRFFTCICAVVILAVPVLFVMPNIAGYTPYVVVSESMTPTLNIGDITYVGKCDPSTLKEGDIVTFYMNINAESATTHRVVSNDTQKRQLITKGDANSQEDIVPIPYLSVIGKVVLSLPALGYALVYLNSDIGRMSYLLIFIIAVVTRFISEKID